MTEVSRPAGHEPDTPLRWGVLSTSRFAETTFIPSLRSCPGTEVVAVASRVGDRARAFAERNQIPLAYSSYEALVDDPGIDIVYVATPGSLHAEWTRKAAERGKHVLCEKPMAMSAAELTPLRPLANQVHIVEGLMVRFHPQWTQTREVIRSGRLGAVSHMHIAFGYHNTDPANIRNIADVGGGALYDIGCYAIAAARWHLEREPRRVAAVMSCDDEFATDRLTSALLEFDGGLTCTLQVSTQCVRHQRVHIIGDAARLELTIPFNHPVDAPVTYLLHDGAAADGLSPEPTVLQAHDHYALEAAAFMHRVRHEPPRPGPLEDAIANMRVIDAIIRAATSGRFEDV